MAETKGLFIEKEICRYNTNVLPVESSYNEDCVWLVTSGAGTVTNNDERIYDGLKSAKVQWTDTTAPLRFYTPSDTKTIDKDGLYVFSHRVNERNFDLTIPFGMKYKMYVFVNASLFAEFVFKNTYVPEDYNAKPNQWNGFFGAMQLVTDAIVTWKYELISGNPAIPSVTHFFDGLKLELDDRNLGGFPTFYTKSE